ncbi:hypothetical protein LSAT2_032170 [Lamellibrachia satsuma]|nr:hypothetical protein LSAT2_032170 [Lamellibrachia satsuma]
MANINLPRYPEFPVTDEPAIASKWEEWLEGSEAMLRAMKVTDAGEKRNMLLHYIGAGGRKLLKCIEDIGGDGDYTGPINALNGYLKPKLNRIYLMNMLHQFQQKPCESIDNFYIRVNEKVKEIKLKELEKNKIIELIKLAQLVNNCQVK